MLCSPAMAQKTSEPSPQVAEALEWLRAECGDWPGVTETTSWGNPTFKANGRTFVVIDRYQGRQALWIRCAGARREALLQQEEWNAAPFDKKQ